MPAPDPFRDIDLPLPGRRSGKVRISYDLPGGRRLFVTTDRLSAFDRVVAAIPWKGQVLNQLSAWWFAQVRHVSPTTLSTSLTRTSPWPRVPRPCRSRWSCVRT